MSALATPVGGRVTTRPFRILLGIVAVAVVLVGVRLARGLGAMTAMNDGYPWGLWIAWDVVVGTALSTGGYAMALLIYVFNRGRYHPLVRSALLTSALGYTMAGVSVTLDLGRWWNVWKLGTFVTRWNAQSVLLEVALCVMLYTAVLWIELAPVFLERWRADDARPRLRRVALRATPVLERALPWIIALGVLLPTMHQSSLGSLLLLAGPKVHPLWQTPLLPLLFLASSVALGYAAVVMETELSGTIFGRPMELPMLRGLRQPVLILVVGYLVVRVVDVVARGRLGDVLALDGHALLFLLELALFAVPAAMLAFGRLDAARLFQAAMLLAIGGALYRVSTFLLAFDPGRGWRYFPSLGELVITLGIMAGEIALYLLIIRRYPILTAPARRAPVRLPSQALVPGARLPAPVRRTASSL